MALQYLRTGYLGYEDKIADGFYDGGRNVKFKIENGGILFAESPREIILYNAQEDEGLKNDIKKVGKLLVPVADIMDRIRMLALYVSESLGGPGSPSLGDLSDEDIRRISFKNPCGLDKIHIGKLKHGSCRHRSGKFKYLADRVGIPSKLVRGGYGFNDSPHAWNMVDVGGENYKVDVMLEPEEVKKAESPDSSLYHREGVVEGYEGGVGDQSVEFNLHVLASVEAFRKRREKK
jgi:hypothetical protein